MDGFLFYFSHTYIFKFIEDIIQLHCFIGKSPCVNVRNGNTVILNPIASTFTAQIASMSLQAILIIVLTGTCTAITDGTT